MHSSNRILTASHACISSHSNPERKGHQEQPERKNGQSNSSFSLMTIIHSSYKQSSSGLHSFFLSFSFFPFLSSTLSNDSKHLNNDASESMENPWKRHVRHEAKHTQVCLNLFCKHSYGPLRCSLTGKRRSRYASLTLQSELRDSLCYVPFLQFEKIYERSCSCANFREKHALALPILAVSNCRTKMRPNWTESQPPESEEQREER